MSAASGADDEPELYKADDFRMYCMKVRRTPLPDGRGTDGLGLS